MKTNSLDQLIKSARKVHSTAPATEKDDAPFGFSTQVAARWVDANRPARGIDLYERLGWWGAALSGAICLLVFAQRTSLPEPNPFDVFMEADTTATEGF